MNSKLYCIITDNKNPYINLATEEFLTFNAKEQDIILFLWQNEKTVVIGRNQNAWKECHVEAIKEDNAYLARRMSGGGAVFHDLGNLNFTIIANDTLYDKSKQTSLILDAVRSFGINAVKNGRNDLTIDEKKFSGNAYYKHGKYCYHHGTLLLDVDKEMMKKYLNVSKVKLQSKGVASVKSRVTNLAEYVPNMTVDAMNQALLNSFRKLYGSEVEMIDANSIQGPQLEELIKKYSSEEWRLGKKLPFEQSLTDKFNWGDVNICLHMQASHIECCQLYSDSLETDIFSALEKALIGIKYDRAAVSSVDYSKICSSDAEKQIANDIIKLISNNI